MEKMFNDYKDIAEFFVVYISEAHAVDERRPAATPESRPPARLALTPASRARPSIGRWSGHRP